MNVMLDSYLRHKHCSCFPTRLATKLLIFIKVLLNVSFVTNIHVQLHNYYRPIFY